MGYFSDKLGFIEAVFVLVCGAVVMAALLCVVWLVFVAAKAGRQWIVAKAAEWRSR